MIGSSYQKPVESEVEDRLKNKKEYLSTII